MKEHTPQEPGRRRFLKTLAAGAVAAGATALPARAAGTVDSLQVWSCGGLAEAMRPAHEAYTAAGGPRIIYTGAFAGALGKSLLSGSGSTEIFAGRVLALAQNLRKAGKMLYFRPLCFTSYVIAVPKGNPAGVTALEDLAEPGLRVAMSPLASPPGGQAVMGILKAAELTGPVMKNVIDNQATCVQRTIEDVTGGKADAMIVERRITRMPLYAPHVELVEIPEKFFPVGPLTFTVGVMRDARDKAAADAYVNWIVGPEGQAFFERAGFIPAASPKGQELTEKLGVKDVA